MNTLHILIPYFLCLILNTAMGSTLKPSKYECDTILVERIDASDFFMSYKFSSIKNDTAATNIIQREEKKFLTKMGIPWTGLSRNQTGSIANRDSLLKNYEHIIDQLRDSPHLMLYRRFCSEWLVKYICVSNLEAFYDLSTSNNRLLFFLNEMKMSESRNIELVYTSFLKLQYCNSYRNICKNLNYFLPYYRETLLENGNYLKEVKNEFSGSLEHVYLELVKRHMAKGEYLRDLELMQSVTCK